MNVDGEILKVTNYGVINKFENFSMCQDDSFLYILHGVSILKIEINQFVNKFIISEWDSESMFIDSFCKNSIIATRNLIDMKLLFLQYEKFVKIPLPLNLTEGCKFELTIHLNGLFIIILNENIYYNWKINSAIICIDEENVDQISDGAWESVPLFNYESEKKYFLNKISIVYTNEICDSFFSILIFYYNYDDKSLYSKTYIMQLKDGECVELKSFISNICTSSFTEESHVLESVFEKLLVVSFNDEYPMVVVAINRKCVDKKPLISYLHLLHGTIVTYELPFKHNQIICDIKWDKSTNFLFGFTSNGFLFCCSKFGSILQINLYNSNILIASGYQVFPFMSSQKRIRANSIIGSCTGHNSITYSNGKELSFVTIGGRIHNGASLEIDDFINAMIKFATVEYLSMLPIKTVQRPLAKETRKDDELELQFYAHSKLKVIMKSMLGFTVSSKIENTDCLFLLDVVFELLAKYILLEIELISREDVDMCSKQMKVDELVADYVTDFVSLDSVYQLFYPNCYSFILFFANYLQDKKLNSDTADMVVQFILIIHCLKSLVGVYLDVYFYRLSSELDVLPCSLSPSSEDKNVCDLYNVTKIYSIMHRINRIGKSLSEFMTSGDHEVFSRWQNWYRYLFTSSSHVTLCADKISVNDYAHSLKYYTDRLENLGKNGRKIYSKECMKDLHSLLYIFIIVGNFDDCFQLMDYICCFRVFSVENLPTNLDFLRWFSDQMVSKKTQASLTRSTLVQSMARILGAYFTEKPVFVFDPDQPYPISSMDMEQQKGTKIGIDRVCITKWLSQCSSHRNKYSIGYCIHLCIISEKIEEAIAIALRVHNHEVSLTLIYLAKTLYNTRGLDVPSKYKSETEKIVDEAVVNYLESENNAYFRNVLMHIVAMPVSVEDGVVAVVCDIIIRGHVMPKLRSLTLLVPDNVRLPLAPIYCTQHCSSCISLTRSRHCDYHEINTRRSIHDLLDLFLTVLKLCGIEGSQVLDEVERVPMTQSLRTYVDVVQFMLLRDQASLSMRERHNLTRCDLTKWVKHSQDCFRALSRLMPYRDFVSDENVLQQQIMTLLHEFDPDLSVVHFLVTWRYNEASFQASDCKLIGLLRGLLGHWKYVVYQGDGNGGHRSILPELSADNDERRYRDTNFSCIYYDMMSHVTNHGLVLRCTATNQIDSKFVSFIDVYLSENSTLHKLDHPLSALESPSAATYSTIDASIEQAGSGIREMCAIIEKLINWANEEIYQQNMNLYTKIIIDKNIVWRLFFQINL